jgi:nucleotide-binding universal stress UspA family protein
MAAQQRPIVVGINESPGAEAAIRWAVDDARARKLPVRLIHAYRRSYPFSRIPMYADIPGAEVQEARHMAEGVVGRMIDHARALDPGVEVDGEAIDGDAVETLISQSAYASLLVLGSRHLKALGSVMLGSVSAAVSARAGCPTVVVRGQPWSPVGGAAVVVGVDGTQAAETVLQFGFDHASRHHAPLRAVLCWHAHLLGTAMSRPELPAPARVEAWLSESLAGWREKYPDVEVHSEVIKEHAPDGLLIASQSQYLLVVGSRGRRAIAGTLLGSVSQGVLHHATCPVAVVPTHRE